MRTLRQLARLPWKSEITAEEDAFIIRCQSAFYEEKEMWGRIQKFMQKVNGLYPMSSYTTSFKVGGISRHYGPGASHVRIVEVNPGVSIVTESLGRFRYGKFQPAKRIVRVTHNCIYTKGYGKTAEHLYETRLRPSKFGCDKFKAVVNAELKKLKRKTFR